MGGFSHQPIRRQCFQGFHEGVTHQIGIRKASGKHQGNAERRTPTRRDEDTRNAEREDAEGEFEDEMRTRTSRRTSKLPTERRGTPPLGGWTGKTGKDPHEH
jgi:hypothetical protein